MQVYEKLPGHVGFDTVPSWWPLPWVALAGLLTAFAIQRRLQFAGIQVIVLPIRVWDRARAAAPRRFPIPSQPRGRVTPDAVWRHAPPV